MHLDHIAAAPLHHEPFDYLYAQATIDPAALTDIVKDFPEVPAGGSFDVTALYCGPAFRHLVAELRSDAFRKIVEEKFGLDLTSYPLHVTVRGKVRGKDGGIHTDSKEKILTGLLYLNPEWDEEGGRLRLLRNGDNIDDYALEIPPVAGNMVIFRRSDTAWHGHLPSERQRMSLQFNWVTSEAYVKRELIRHRLSGWLKGLLGGNKAKPAA